MERIKKHLLYAGLDRERYEELLPDALSENSDSLKFISLFSLVFFSALCVFNQFQGGISKQNTLCYALMALSCGIIFLCVKLYLPKRPNLILALDTLYILTLYAFSNFITLFHPDYPAVTSIAVMLVSPFLFTERPIWQIGLIFVQVVALSLLSRLTKPAGIAYIDVWNAITFGIVASIAELFQEKSRFRTLALTRHVRYLSETDLLTGAKNRNHYEERAPLYAGECHRNLVCVYADVNGLHELNDTKGHKAGDEMLQAVARELLDYFGRENVYRMGGDEFVAFRMDSREDEVSAAMKRICASLGAKGYNLSAGVASADKQGLELARLMTDAEMKMYLEKQKYYTESGRDRRRR